jgi:type I restriction enzyme R subunit
LWAAQSLNAPPDEPVTTITRPRDGTTLQVVGEIFYELGPDGSTLRALSYNDYTKAALSDLIANPGELRAHWLRAEQRAEIERRLQDEGVDMELLARLVNLTDADPFDLLLHVAFGEQALTRRERANRVRRERADFFAQYVTAAREILEIILQKYEAGEAPDVSDTDLLRVPPLSERGTFMELAQHFSGGASMRAALRELHTLLYSA